LGILLWISGSAPAVSKQDLDLWSLLPPLSENPVWSWGEDPSIYEPENLFEHLNGAAPQYISYGFVKLLHCLYIYKNRELESVALDIFDMGSPLGAYGIYSSGRPREITKRSWGVEGYRSGTVAAAWKGQIYVHASADTATPLLVGKLEAILDQVCKAVPGESEQPPQLRAFPRNGLISGSDRYIGKNLLGHSFLPGGFLANYKLSGGEGLLFFCTLDNPEIARTSFHHFYSFEKQRGKLVEGDQIGEMSFWAEDAGLGFGVVMKRLTYVAGLWGIKDVQMVKELMTELDENLISLSLGVEEDGI
jgi:hypothetical protein